jgi:hypothetical protein
VAVINGTENKAELENLGHDIFDYFGLGCRNVSKIYFPADYNVATFFEGIESHQPIINHHKYNNNYDYNKSIYLVNGDKHYDNGFLLLKEDKNLTSPLAVVFYEKYENLEALTASLIEKQDEIQCIVSKAELNMPTFEFGQSQSPKLWDYADNVNTIEFLNKLA